MKKKVIIGISIVIIVLSLIPFPIYYKDGGSVEYRAILYKVTKYHTINFNSESGYTDGLSIEILGIEIYNNL